MNANPGRYHDGAITIAQFYTKKRKNHLNQIIITFDLRDLKVLWFIKLLFMKFNLILTIIQISIELGQIPNHEIGESNGVGLMTDGSHILQKLLPLTQVFDR